MHVSRELSPALWHTRLFKCEGGLADLIGRRRLLVDLRQTLQAGASSVSVVVSNTGSSLRIKSHAASIRIPTNFFSRQWALVVKSIHVCWAQSEPEAELQAGVCDFVSTLQGVSSPSTQDFNSVLAIAQTVAGTTLSSDAAEKIRIAASAFTSSAMRLDFGFIGRKLKLWRYELLNRSAGAINSESFAIELGALANTESHGFKTMISCMGRNVIVRERLGTFTKPKYAQLCGSSASNGNEQPTCSYAWVELITEANQMSSKSSEVGVELLWIPAGTKAEAHAATPFLVAKGFLCDLNLALDG